DNIERALFFGRAVLDTIQCLGWRPDVVHAFGWMSGFVPMLLRSEYATEPLYETAKSILTPDRVDVDTRIDDAFGAAYGLNQGLVGRSASEVGVHFADMSIYPQRIEPVGPNAIQFTDDGESNGETARTVYEQLMSEVAA